LRVYAQPLGCGAPLARASVLHRRDLQHRRRRRPHLSRGRDLLSSGGAASGRGLATGRARLRLAHGAARPRLDRGQRRRHRGRRALDRAGRRPPNSRSSRPVRRFQEPRRLGDRRMTAHDPADSLAHVRFISAGAGSGKTYRLTQELERALVDDRIPPSRIIGTTFTVKAASELRERVRQRLVAGGRGALAGATAQALIGTVHSVAERLLRRFAFELGLSPELSVASVEDGASFFNQALDDVLAPNPAAVRRMNGVAFRLGIEDWRADVKTIADRA